MATEADYSALTSVIKQIEEGADKASHELLAYADDTSDDTRLRHALTHSHELYGLVRQMPFETVVLLANEIETCCQGLLSQEFPVTESSLQAILAAILQLPGYIKRVAHARQEFPQRVISICNEMRQVRGEELLSTSADDDEGQQQIVLPETSSEYLSQASEEEIVALRRDRQRFQATLLDLLRDEDAAGCLQRLQVIMADIARRSQNEGQRAFWEAAAALAETAAGGGLALNKKIKTLLRNLDHELKLMQVAGEQLHSRMPDATVYSDTVRLLASSSQTSEAVKSVFQRHGISTEAADGSGPLDDFGGAEEVAKLVRGELLEQQAQLEAAVEESRPAHEIMSAFSEIILRSSLTVMVPGWQSEQQQLASLATKAAELSSQAVFDTDQLSDFAEGILRAIADIDERLVALGASGETVIGHLGRARETVFIESLNQLESLRQQFSDAAASGADAELVSAASESLAELVGVMFMLEQPRLRQLLAACGEQVTLLAEGERAESGDRLPLIVDAIGALEEFIEHHANEPEAASAILNAVAEQLKVPGLAAADIPAEAAAREEPAETKLPPPADLPAADVAGEELEPEILEIFLEEAQEVQATLEEHYPRWAESGDKDSLTEVRRSFHTLKGSGRMVGAERIGELAWSVESLLNKLIEGSVTLSPTVTESIARAVGLLSGLVSAFAGRGTADMAGVVQVQQVCEALVRGETAEFTQTAVAQEEPEAVVVTEDTPEEHSVTQPEVVAPADLPEADVAGEELEPEILEIFLEEAQEVQATLEEHYPRWAESEDKDSLTEVRRSFHTLKGSGRMVGAERIGELAWSVENLLNKLIDGSVTLVPAVTESVGRALGLLPGLVSAFGGRGGADMAGVVEVQQIADALARGEAVELAQASTPSAEEVEQLLAVFIDELKTRLSDIKNYLKAAAKSADSPIDDELLRTLHTLRGHTNIVGAEAVTRAVTPLEMLVRETAVAGEPLDEQSRDFLQKAVKAFGAWIKAPKPLEDSPKLQKLSADLDEHLAVIRTRLREGPAVALPEGIAGLLETGIERFFHASSIIENWQKGDLPSKEKQQLADELGAISARAGSAGFDVVASLINPLHNLIDLGARVEEGLADDFFSAVRSALNGLMEMMDRAAAGQPVHAMTATIEVLQEEIQKVQTLPTIESPGTDEAPDIEELAAVDQERVTREIGSSDPELLGVFMEEAEELLTAIDESVDAWRHDRENREYFDGLQRLLHTLKGGARMASLKSLGDLSHNFETLLINHGLKFGTFDDNFFNDVLTFHERLLTTVDLVRSVRSEPEPAEQPEEPVEEAVPEQEVVPDEPRAVAAPKPVMRASAAEQAAARTEKRGEVVRVSAELLEELVNLAGETSISRARVQERVSDFSYFFDEMETTISRLQNQVRRLDLATQAQILFRREKLEEQGVTGFDPLEMDQYSQLQQLSRSLVESSSDLVDIKRTLEERSRDLETVLLQQSRINSELQEGLMRSRMLPFASVLPRLRRVIRQVSGELDKPVEFVTHEISGEIDRSILERLVTAIEHMLRNAVDHGIEPAKLRKKAGKEKTGKVEMLVSRDGGDIVINLRDDGRGIDVDAVRAKAEERELLEPGAPISDMEVLQYIFHPGFSTAEKVTQISGRGVGLDVVNNEIRQLGGSVEMTSEVGQGTEFTVRLPFTVSVSRALMICIGKDTYALPLTTVEGVVRIPQADLEKYYAPNGPDFRYAGRSYRLRYAGQLLQTQRRPQLDPAGGPLPVVLVRGGDQSIAVQVDRLLGAGEIVVKGLGSQFAMVQGLAGATVLGDGSVVVILDLPAILRAYAFEDDNALLEEKETLVIERGRRTSQVMVVDDSVTVRKVTSRFLEREGMDVLTARDGADAILQMQEQVPDLVLLDIEMPNMDGFEVLSKMRLSDRLKDVAVIMITSRSGTKHRDRAFSLGANEYFGKPYQEKDLLEVINQLLPKHGARGSSQ